MTRDEQLALMALGKLDEEAGWEALKALPVQTVLWEETRKGLRLMLVRGPGSICAYVGVQEGHPAFGAKYEDVDMEVHGGLTFGRAGSADEVWSEDFWWLGWDHAHFMDATFYDGMFGPAPFERRKWLMHTVLERARETLEKLAR